LQTCFFHPSLRFPLQFFCLAGMPIKAPRYDSSCFFVHLLVDLILRLEEVLFPTGEEPSDVFLAGGLVVILTLYLYVGYIFFLSDRARASYPVLIVGPDSLFLLAAAIKFLIRLSPCSLLRVT